MAVLKGDQLKDDLKDAMLSGYTKIEYSLICNELTSEQRKQVSSRMRAIRASDQSTPKTPAR